MQSNLTEVRPFRLEVSQDEIDDLRRRIDATRWPTRELVTDRSQGVQLAAIQSFDGKPDNVRYNRAFARSRLRVIPVAGRRGDIPQAL